MKVPRNQVCAVAAGAEVAIHLAAATKAYDCISHLSHFYPGFEGWYWGKVVPGVSQGCRLVHVVKREDRIVGVLIAKREAGEKKICTLWVENALKGSGLGVRLIHFACDWLETARPLASVPEERMPELSGVLGRLGFRLTERLDSFYRLGKTEFVFNGRLSRLQS
jgi:GNAT superfamily N-acetyltransferase